ncbi:MAG: NfeD family protein [Pseudomonadota bacterium]
MDLLAVLEGISPWWWVALAFALGAAELATGTYVLIWVALAAFQMAGLLWFFPGLSGAAQLVIFAVVAVGLTFAGRAFLRSYGDGAPVHSTLNNRGAHLVGGTARVLDFQGGSGAVEVEGMRWRATWPTGQEAEPGAKVRITAAQGMQLTVTNL